MKFRGQKSEVSGQMVFLISVLCSLTSAFGQGTQTPIYNGLLQSDLDAAGFKINGANLADYAGTNMTWNVATGKFDATGGGGSGTVTSITATGPIIVTPSPLTATGVVSLDAAYFDLWNTAWNDRLKWDGGATGLVAATGRTSLGLVIGTNVAPATSGTSILYGNGSGGFSNVTIGTNLTFSAGTLNATAGGTGTVTDFSAGNLSPLFTTTEATTTTTPALSFALDATSPATSVYGRAAGTIGTASFSTAPQFLKIGNLTTNGFVKTGSSDGTLSVDTATYLTANQNISLTGDVTGGPSATSIATTIGNNKVTLGMMATMATDSILGRATASTGNVEVLAALPFAWSGGDVTRAADSNTETIAAGAVTYAKMQNVSATSRFLGRITAAAGVVEELTAANAKTILSLTPTDVGLSNVTNDAQTKASIVPNTAPGAGQLLIGNAGATAYAPQTMGTDATITSAGALTIANNAVTLGKMATMATDSILGRATAATGNVEVLAALPWADTGDVTRPIDSKVTTLAAGNAGNLNSGTLLAARMPAYTGDVTSSAGATVNTIANNAVTYGKMQAVSAVDKLLGSSHTTTAVQEITLGTNLSMSGTTLNATGGGGTTFIGLTDVPASYSGAGSKVVAVNAGATALEFISAPAAGAGGSTTQVQYNSSGSLAGSANMVWDNTNGILTLAGSTTTSTLKVGTLETQGFGLGNAWLGENMYFDGAAFKFRATGSAGLFYFFGTEGQFRFFPSGTAGTAPAGGDRSQLKVNSDGTVAIGNSINTTAANYSGSAFLIRPTATAQIGIAANYDLGWSSSSADASATIDTGLYRNAAGVVEVNNGTAGTYRDLIARTLTLSGTGGAGQVLKQTSAGGAVTAGTLAASDVGLGNVTNDAQIKSNDFPSTSVDNEISLFSSTSGKAQKRAAGTGIVTAATGVIGYVTAPAGAVVGTTDTQTLTNKRINRRVVTQASGATWSPAGDTTDVFTITTAQATNVTTISAPTGTPVDGQKLMFRIKCDATPRTLTGWNAIYRFSSDMTAPSTLVASKTFYMGFVYNSTDSTWDNVAQINNF